MLPKSDQILKEESTISAVIPLNIFQSVQSKTPAKTVNLTVAKIASAMRSKPMFVPRKEAARLLTFNTYTEGAISRGTSCIEWAHAICGDWDKHFDWYIFDKGMAELAGGGAQVIAYQTYSHKPDAQRWRIFVFLDEPVAPVEYKSCWLGLNDIFGGNLDDNAKDCARLNYWPSCPPGQTRDFRTLNIEVA